jgi:3-phosphoglycerate kinase
VVTRLAPAAQRLSALLGRQVKTVPVIVGPEAEAAAQMLKPGHNTQGAPLW